MDRSQGGVALDYIDGLTFPDLADLWETAVLMKR